MVAFVPVKTWKRKVGDGVMAQPVKPLPYEHQYPSVDLQSRRKAVGDWGRSVMTPVGELEDEVGDSTEGGDVGRVIG